MRLSISLMVGMILMLLNVSFSYARECPITFFEFMTLYFGDKNYQREYTSFPLTKVYLYADYSDIGAINLLYEEDTPFFLPTFKKMEESGLLWRIELNPDFLANVTIWQDGTGYLVNYFFRKDKCWKLIRIVDSGT